MIKKLLNATGILIASVAFFGLMTAPALADAGIFSGSFAGVSSSDLVVGATSTSYDVSFDTGIAATATSITLTFPAGYSITNGAIATSTIFGSGTGDAARIHVDGVFIPVTSITGNSAARTITIGLGTPFDLGTDEGTSFRLTSGITNPTTTAAMGNFAITDNAAGEIAQTDIAGVTLTPEALDYIVVSPATGALTSITADGNQPFTAEGFDIYDNSKGNATGTTFEVLTGGGSFTGATYYPTTVGPVTVRGTYSGKTDDSGLAVTIGAAAAFGQAGLMTARAMPTNPCRSYRPSPEAWCCHLTICLMTIRVSMIWAPSLSLHPKEASPRCTMKRSGFSLMNQKCCCQT